MKCSGGLTNEYDGHHLPGRNHLARYPDEEVHKHLPRLAPRVAETRHRFVRVHRDRCEPPDGRSTRRGLRSRLAPTTKEPERSIRATSARSQCCQTLDVLIYTHGRSCTRSLTCTRPLFLKFVVSALSNSLAFRRYRLELIIIK